MTIPSKSQRAEASVAVKRCSEMERFFYIYRQRGRENERDRQRWSEREESDRFQWHCASQPLPQCFLPTASSEAYTWKWSRHRMHPKRRTAPLKIQNNCHLKPESVHLMFFHITISSLFRLNLNCGDIANKTKKNSDTHPCNCNISTINKSHFTNAFLY